MGWTRADASHLLMRAGLGGSMHQVESLYSLGRLGAIEYLLNIENLTAPAWDLNPGPGGEGSLSGRQEEVAMLLRRLLTSPYPLQARLTWFWLDHFAPAIRMAGSPSLDAQTRALWMHAGGPYKSFLPALYREGVINGHLAGAGPGFSDQAVLRRLTENSRQLEDGDTLVADGDDAGRTPDRAALVRRLFDRPDTMREVCMRLHRAFVGPLPDGAELARLLDAWKRSGGRMVEVIRTLLRGPVFWDARVRGALPKGPLEYVAGLVQRLDVAVDRALTGVITEGLMRMGHWLVRDGGNVTTEVESRGPDARSLMQRYAFARHAVFGIDPQRVALGVTAGIPRRLAPQMFITALSQRMGIASLSAQTRALVTDQLGVGDVIEGQMERVLEALYLLVCAPEYQRS